MGRQPGSPEQDSSHDSGRDRDGATVEVIYALPDEQYVVAVAWTEGLTAGDAVVRSGLAGRFPAIGDPAAVVCGLNGAVVPQDQPLAPDDRVEICRPLIADPREMRFDLVAEGRVMGRNRK